VEIKSKAEIEKMRATCRLAASVLDYIAPHVVPGVTTG
jgi:methionyl aminopeptidase